MWRFYIWRNQFATTTKKIIITFFDGYRICRNLTLINGLYEIIITLNLKDNFCRNFIVSNIFFFVFKRFVCNKKNTAEILKLIRIYDEQIRNRGWIHMKLIRKILKKKKVVPDSFWYEKLSSFDRSDEQILYFSDQNHPKNMKYI